MNEEMSQYINPSPTVDSDNPAIIHFARDNAGSSSGHREQAVRLYYAVRDGIRYDPYSLDLTVEGLRASTTLRTGRGWCVAKAILLAASLRVRGIPARLGFADVRNHLTTARMREVMKTDVFFWHGYTSIFLDGDWIKATPAFNIELCDKFGFKPLEFDGLHDSIYHPFDLAGNRHMEYLRYRGEFVDVPLDLMMETFRKEYTSDLSWKDGADFDREVDEENRKIEPEVPLPSGVEITRGYVPGSIGRIAELHGTYYHDDWGFGLFFEAKCDTDLSEFLKRYDETRDGFWTASLNGRVEGHITIDGIHADDEGAHLRYFIVSDALRGKGIGNHLIREAVDFCRDNGHKRVYLWTFEGLLPARHLYEKAGFRLVEQRRGSQWGVEVNEQRFELNLDGLVKK